jgi:hypothetical protein
MVFRQYLSGIWGGHQATGMASEMRQEDYLCIVAEIGDRQIQYELRQAHRLIFGNPAKKNEIYSVHR